VKKYRNDAAHWEAVAQNQDACIPARQAMLTTFLAKPSQQRLSLNALQSRNISACHRISTFLYAAIATWQRPYAAQRMQHM